jgi:hypothetical protein
VHLFIFISWDLCSFCVLIFPLFCSLPMALSHFCTFIQVIWPFCLILLLCCLL